MISGKKHQKLVYLKSRYAIQKITRLLFIPLLAWYV